MRVEASEESFIRARRRDVHAYLADVGGYGTWWPGVRSRVRSGVAELTLSPPSTRAPAVPARALGRAPQYLRVTVSKERPGLGVLLSVRGAFAGSAEWYYLDEVDGTVVHYLLRAETGDRGGRRRLSTHRSSVRAGLHALKDVLESDRRPGAEPSRALLADQARAIEAFRAGVEAHRRRTETRRG